MTGLSAEEGVEPSDQLVQPVSGGPVQQSDWEDSWSASCTSPDSSQLTPTEHLLAGGQPLGVVRVVALQPVCTDRDLARGEPEPRVARCGTVAASAPVRPRRPSRRGILVTSSERCSVRSLAHARRSRARADAQAQRGCDVLSFH